MKAHPNSVDGLDEYSYYYYQIKNVRELLSINKVKIEDNQTALFFIKIVELAHKKSFRKFGIQDVEKLKEDVYGLIRTHSKFDTKPSIDKIPVYVLFDYFDNWNQFFQFMMDNNINTLGQLYKWDIMKIKQIHPKMRNCLIGQIQYTLELLGLPKMKDSRYLKKPKNKKL